MPVVASVHQKPIIHRLIQDWQVNKPDFLWVPTVNDRFNARNGIIGTTHGSAIVTTGGIANPVANSSSGIYFPTNLGMVHDSRYIGIMLVTIDDPANVTGCFLKIGGDSDGIGFGGGNTSFDDSGSKLIMLRENVAWHTGSNNSFIKGLNILTFGLTSDAATTYTNISSGAGNDLAGVYPLAPSSRIAINGYNGRGSNAVVHAVGIWKTAYNNSNFVAERERLAKRLLPFSGVARKNIIKNFKNGPYSFYYTSSSSGISLTLQNVSSSQSLTSPDLIQQNTLVVNGATSSQTLDNVSLTQQNSLVVNEILENQTIENIVIITGGNLTVQGIISNSILSNIDLIQQNALLLDNIQVTQFLQNVDLTQQNSISVNGLTDSQVLSNVTINQGGTLIVSEITQQVLLEAVNLIQQNILSIDSTNLSQAIENINLIQQNILSIESTLSSETLDNITLNTTLLLNPNSILETVNLSNLILAQANLLAINDLLETSNLSTVSLTGQHVLIVNDTIHSQILQNITLTSGFIEERINGEPVYILKSSPSIMIISAKTTIYLSQP
ncbi:MAG: hypothetical protein M0R47_18965 [Methylobacter sp.]|uniref:hypothetical protein n=1 Tax=Methylobacter sp. TaxID=2051955 RepID=UPI0025F16C65|nr:hypothetical protein [Methylobacter sp.]MCK9622603.1 hypothetical protein [Methylobacter sp.]